MRLTYTSELDLLGPFAQRVLLRHGLVWPPAAFVLVPLLELARGGTLVTGEGGDELFANPRLGALRALHRAPSSRPAARHAAEAVAPRSVRRLVARSAYDGLAPPWLTAPARARLARLLADDEARTPLGFGGWLRRLLARRAWREGRATFAVLAAEVDAACVHPLLDVRVLRALQGSSPPWGFADRSAALRGLFGDLLPDVALARATKAVFNSALFHDHTRRFVAGWDGAGVDPRLVDIATLRNAWCDPTPSVLSAALLQSAWLAGRDR